MKCCPFAILVASVLLAHLLLFASFNFSFQFWICFSISLFILLLTSLMFEKMLIADNWKSTMRFGVGSGLFIFGMIFFGNELIKLLGYSIEPDLYTLYSIITPQKWWHYASLVVIIAPGEELFWRGFVQRRLSKSVATPLAIAIATLLYATAHLSAKNPLFVVAAIILGLFYGTLYVWKEDMPLLILSHIIFDLFLLLVFPLVS